MNGPLERFTEDQRRRYRASLQRVYQRFIDVVATGRDKPEAEVRGVAEGRVWTGHQARSNGLVDHTGGLALAVSRVRELAELGPGPLRILDARFDPSRWGALSMLMGRGAALPTPVDLAVDALGPSGLALEQLRRSPLQAQALEPMALDGPAWSAWSQSP
jgi:ClpP class serine protease